MLQTWLNIPFWTLILGGFQPFEPIVSVICTKCVYSVAGVEAQTGQEAACLL